MKRSKARKDVNKGIDNHNNSNPARKAALEAARIAQERNEDKVAVRLDHRTVIYIDKKTSLVELAKEAQDLDLGYERKDLCHFSYTQPDNMAEWFKKRSCDRSCGPSDFYKGGKCDKNGCYYE